MIEVRYEEYPLILFKSDVVAVIPSNTFNSEAVAVIKVPFNDNPVVEPLWFTIFTISLLFMHVNWRFPLATNAKSVELVGLLFLKSILPDTESILTW